MTAKVIPLVVALVLPGCAGPAISAGTGILLKKTDCNSVVVSTAAIKSDDAGMFVEGTLSKSGRVDSTASSHLDILAYDAKGVRVAEQLIAFRPGEIPGRFRGVGGRTPYRVLLNFPLANVAQVEVRAHEGSHAGRDECKRAEYACICDDAGKEHAHDKKKK